MSATSINVETSISGKHPWFALRVKSRSEKVVASIARNKGYEEFVPLYHRRHNWSDRVKSVGLPLFPGYVFCRLDAQYRLPLLTIPGVLHFVGLGKTPLPIEENEISTIRTAVNSGLIVEPWEYMEIGQRVQLQEGPLAGLEGIYAGNSKQEKIIVSVTMLRRSVAVTIERHWAMPLEANGSASVFRMRPLRVESPA